MDDDQPTQDDGPFNEPDDGATPPADHPQTDTNVDSHEAYDEGSSGTVEQSEGPAEPTPATGDDEDEPV